MLRNAVCWVILALFPFSLYAADNNAAMLYAKGTTWVNGGTVTDSTAVFPGDLVQTRYNSMANINASGSNVMVLSDSLVTFNGNGVSIDHGSVSIKTSRGLQTSAYDLTVRPVADSATEFDVSNTDGKVKIMAVKGDVSIADESGTSTLSQGQQTEREPTLAKKKRHNSGAAPAAGGGLLDSPIVVGAGTAAIGGLIIWVALQSAAPASPKTP
jgi:hypothetical protein